jgi:transcriptional regulator with XRE-family HTH domain
VAGLTQVELGDALGITGNAVSKIEGGYATLTLDHLFKLPKILGQSISYFLGLPEADTTPPLTPDESELLGLYRALPEGFPRDSARGILRTLLETVRRNRGLGDDGKPLLVEPEGPE